MTRKGKFKLLSYVNEEFLIFYTSLNKNKKILAFSIIEAKDFYPLVSIFNKFLNKGFLNYYSIQIDVNHDKKKVYVLNFEDNKKERIVKLFNIIYQKLKENKISFQFLRNKQLEKKFLNILIKNSNSDLSLLKKNGSIIIEEDKISSLLNFYNINFDNHIIKNTFISNFSKLSKNFNRKGNIIFNIKEDFNGNLIIAVYFVDISNGHESNDNFKNKMNDFYNYSLLEKQKIVLRDFYRVLWRYKISDKFYFFNEVSELFLMENQYDFQDLLKFNRQFEYNLLKNQIKFKRLNKNLLFIEQKALFLSTNHLDLELILRILKKYYSKYLIYILILNESDFNELLKIENINMMENIKIMSPREFFNLNYDTFKKKLFLKNTQINGNILSRVVRM
ncbi:MAG: hypothetical protein ACFFAH_17660 [Promethearchaeota archaeon]